MAASAIFYDISDHWILLGLAVFVSYLISNGIYNLYFSPLAKYPGPFWAKVSTLPSFYHSRNGCRHVWIWQNHQVYGNIVRIQPNEVVINSPSAYRSIYGSKANVRKGDIYKVWRQDIRKPSTITEVDNTIHGRKKRFLTSVLSDKAISSAETFIIQHVDRWCKILLINDRENESQNVGDLADQLIFDIMCDLIFGKSFDIKERKENPLKSVPRTLVNYTSFMDKISRSPLLNSWLWLKSHGLNSILEKFKPKDMQLFFAGIRTNLYQRIQAEANTDLKIGRKDLFYYLFHNKDVETGKPTYSQEELALEAGVLLTAGLGTTSNVLAAFFFYITRNQSAYKRLTDEIRTIFTSAEEIRAGVKLSSCQYLRACIDETLRTMPAGPSETIRLVLKGGLEVDGDLLPEGVLVGTALWSLLHNDEYFRDPWVYRPERWIMDENRGVSQEDVTRAQAAFFPFATGRTNCVGQKLAKSMLFVTIARTLYQMDVFVPEGNVVGAGAKNLGWGMNNKNVFQVRDAFFSKIEGPVAVFKRREFH